MLRYKEIAVDYRASGNSKRFVFQADKAKQLWDEKKYDQFIQCLPSMLTSSIAVLKYLNVMVNMDKVRNPSIV